MSMQSNEPEQQGFTQSVSRSLVEILIILGVVAGIGVLLVWGASKATDWVLPFVPMALEERVGQASFDAYSLQAKSCDNAELQTFVHDLMKQVVKASGHFEPPFHVTVVDDEVPNAFALPGGFVVVNAGLLSTAKDGDEVAAVLAHEWAHVTHRHGMRRVLRAAGAGIAFNLLLGGTDVGTLVGYAEGLVHKSYDRNQESEADETGHTTMKAMGLSPSAMGRFFRRLQQQTQGPDMPTFLSTHPDLLERAKKAEKDSPEGAVRGGLLPANLSCHSGKSEPAP